MSPKRSWLWSTLAIPVGLVVTFLAIGSLQAAPAAASTGSGSQTVHRVALTVGAQSTILLRTKALTVADLLKREHISLSPSDRVQPGLFTHLGAFTSVTVTIVTHKRYQVWNSMPYTVKRVADASLPKGSQVVEQPGAMGLARVRETVATVNGVVKSARIEARSVQQAPQAEIVAYGTNTGVGSTGINYNQVLTVLTTGYWPDPSWSSGYTKTGLKAQYGVVAVDPSVIPLGSHLYIPGYGPAIAADTGSAVIGDHVDLCFNGPTQAIDWGRRYLQVYVSAP